MPVTFHIPGPLRIFTGGHSSVVMERAPNTLRDALEMLWAQYPGLRDRIATEQGEIRQHINVFVGDENIRFANGLATEIPDGSEITIVPSISGG